MTLSRSPLLAVALALSATFAASAAPVLHVGDTRGSNQAYQFDWRAGSATVIATQGRSEALVVTTGPQRLVTLAVPFTSTFETIDFDCPDQPLVLIRNEVLQVAVTRLSGNESRGTSKVIQLGTDTTIGGCNDGRVVPFGSLADPGFTTRHLAASLRPSMGDLVPGVTLAGPSDQPGIDVFPAADVITVGAGVWQFPTSGISHPVATVSGWAVLDLGALGLGERAYTRFAVDRNGALR